MSSLSDPADVFIGYSRRDGKARPDSFSNLLDPENAHASFMKGNICYYDDQLSAGENWAEELEKNASGCKVFVAVVGKGWLEVLKQRHEGEDGTPIAKDERSSTDWVYKELEFALEERDEPARMLIVCIDGAVFEPSMAIELFPPGKVRDYFSSPTSQILKYGGNRDNVEFCEAIRNLLTQHHSGVKPNSSGSTKQSLLNTVEPWLNFIGRDAIWATLSNNIGIGSPKQAMFDIDPDKPKSVAMLCAYDDRKDNPRDLVKGISLHLHAKGRFEDALDANMDSDSLEEHWTDIKSFGWPGYSGGVNGLFMNILETLPGDMPEDMQKGDIDAQSFAAILAKRYSANPKMSHCLYTSLRKPDRNDLKLILEFVELWNGLDWSVLSKKLVLTIAIRTTDVDGLLTKYQESTAACERIALISADCLEEWIEGFLQDRLRIDNLPEKPTWWKQVKDYEIPDEEPLRFSVVKRELNR